MEFFDQTGKMAIGSRLRMLTNKITDDATAIYKMFGVDLKPKWFPVFFVLSHGESKTITAIAKQIGHSHPSVSNIIREMAAKGVIEETKDDSDKRRNLVRLSSEGLSLAGTFMEQCVDVESAVEQIIGQTQNDLWQAIEEWEFLLSEKSLLQRVKEQKRVRENADIRIVNYEARYQEIFKSLNTEWINKYFSMEETDYTALDNPQKYILDKGGYIFVALYKDTPVGVCALIKINDGLYDYEMSKLAVSPNVQGKGIGLLLAQTAVKKAIDSGGTKLYLESNTILESAIHIYKKLGFKKIAGHHTYFKRCNIQMELIVDELPIKNTLHHRDSLK